MNGGTVVVNGPTSGGDGALDYDKEFIINGGTLITAGSAQMNQAPSDSSQQSSIVMTFPNTQEANSALTLTDSAGNIIAAFAPQKPYQAVVISTPEIQNGQSYTINTVPPFPAMQQPDITAKMPTVQVPHSSPLRRKTPLHTSTNPA